MAVATSCTAGASIRYLTRGMTANSTGGKLVVLNAIVSMIACAMGGFANNWCIRQPEVTSGGIQIQDPSNVLSSARAKFVLEKLFGRQRLAVF